MNKFFEYGSVEEIPWYNCSSHTPQEWSEFYGVRRPIHGILEVIYGIFLTCLYLPIISILLEKEHIKLSCYKIMTCLAIIDILAIWDVAITTGILAYQGAVYCTYPTLIYISGAFGLGLWCCSCLIALILVLNRLLDLTKTYLGELLFAGNRTYIVLTGCILYGLYFVFCTPPVLFNSKFHTWFFDPKIFDNEAEHYTNISHRFNNIGVVGITACLYISFCFVMGSKLKKASEAGGSTKSSKNGAQVFIQSAIICIVNQFSAITYVTMNWIDVPLWFIIFGHTTWQLGHAAPALVYTCLNKTIRNGLGKKFCKCWKKRGNGKKRAFSVTQSTWITTV